MVNYGNTMAFVFLFRQGLTRPHYSALTVLRVEGDLELLGLSLYLLSDLKIAPFPFFVIIFCLLTP